MAKFCICLVAAVAGLVCFGIAGGAGMFLFSALAFGLTKGL